MTNGEKIKEIFPNGVLTSINNSYYWGDDILVSKNWWNAEYKEPTTKNNLGVDWDELKRKILMEVDGGTDDKWLSYADVCDNISNSIDEFKADMPSVTPQEPRWIPVSERLPEERLGVLVWCPTRKNIYCACYEEKQWWIFGAYLEKVTEEIVAWRPLPIKPYSEAKE